ncbi:MAG: NisI/SpaI family lantibiotic immunity lipoprotein, partial [Turicibacter sp.]|nr:NisI/SpaI family lantibiotic immunity lipoprotein [Turicibacter sp.]
MKKLMMIVLIWIVVGCEKLEDLKEVAMTNLQMNQQLPICTLNTETFDEVVCHEQRFQISDEVIDLSLVDDSIAKVNVSFILSDGRILSKEELREIQRLPEDKLEERTYLSFGWI